MTGFAVLQAPCNVPDFTGRRFFLGDGAELPRASRSSRTRIAAE